jgi:hypothetical protein
MLLSRTQADPGLPDIEEPDSHASGFRPRVGHDRRRGRPVARNQASLKDATGTEERHAGGSTPNRRDHRSGAGRHTRGWWLVKRHRSDTGRASSAHPRTLMLCRGCGSSWYRRPGKSPWPSDGRWSPRPRRRSPASPGTSRSSRCMSRPRLPPSYRHPAPVAGAIGTDRGRARGTVHALCRPRMRMAYRMFG